MRTGNALGWYKGETQTTAQADGALSVYTDTGEASMADEALLAWDLTEVEADHIAQEVYA